jgi:DNA-binding SARP family transcriptional activator
LRNTADYLAHRGDTSLCLPLYSDLKDFESASQVLVENSQTMLDLGQWVTLEQWLDKLPKPILQDFPSLLYVQGELQAARGNLSAGMKTFSIAAKTFSQKEDYTGACESLLAEGTLAAWQSDSDKAQICFLKAETIAQSENLAVHLGWINWTRGYFSSIESNPEEALKYFDQTFKTIRDPALVVLYQKAKKLLEQQNEIRQQQENLSLSFQKLSQSNQEITRNLALLLTSPSNRSPIINSLGWARMPLILKIPPPGTEVDQRISEEETTGSLLVNFMSNLSDLAHRIRKAFSNGKTNEQVLVNSSPLPIEPFDQSDQNIRIRKKSEGTDSGVISSFVEIPADGIMIFNQTELKKNLTAQLLGSCRISIDDHAIEDQISGRSLAVFQYLVFHHAQKQHREILMSVFWPDAPPDSARNNLNVALHSLRQVFRKVTDLPVIEFHNGAYHFNPKLQIWLDVDNFEQHIQAGFANEQSGAIELAMQEYEIGVNLYQDDFLIDDPYEEWALAPRERLRIAYLNALGSLSQIYFSQEQYPACVVLCQRILERDNCREDTHSLLMRCYSRLGQRSLALRQYQVCVDALQSELGVNPVVETKQLAERIRKLEEI